MVNIVSRQDVDGELRLMRAMVAGLDESQAAQLDQIFCDSNAGYCFSVVVRRGTPLDDMRQIAARMADVSRETVGGHNGIYVAPLRDGLTAVTVDPEWIGGRA